MTNIAAWNERFALGDGLQFVEGPNGMPIVNINNHHAKASIALQGAHVLGYQAVDQEPLIWMSEDATYAPGKSLRGGVPICWPWFGPHATDSNKPGHGHARTVSWLPTASNLLASGAHELTFTLADKAQTEAVSGFALDVKLTITVGATLKFSMTSTNLGSTEYTLGEALHTYFLVGDVSKVKVEGLDGCAYLDKVDGMSRKTQQGPVTIASEVDRIYFSDNKQCRIVDETMQRVIHIYSKGSAATVVWNPWLESANKMGDLGKDGYLKMLCVENAIAANAVVKLAGGASHTLDVEYAVESLSN